MLDAELAPVLDLLPEIDLSDPVAARAAYDAVVSAITLDVPGAETLRIEDRTVPGRAGQPEVHVRVYRPMAASAEQRVPGVLWIHGGGFVIGSIDAEHAGTVQTAVEVGAVVVSVGYRLAPEHPYPAALEDCYAALCFLHDEADALGVDPARVAVAGGSAGGGLAAGLALAARDRRGPAICFQLLQIPELDDRLGTPSMKAFVDTPLWNRPLAEQSWRAYLGDRCGAADVPPYAAPARATDLSGLPPAYVSTAELDPLRDEGIEYALHLLQSGVSVELHQFAGTFHGSTMVTTAAVSIRAQREVSGALRRALRVEGERSTTT